MHGDSRRRIILASGSPRRRALAEAEPGWNVRVIVPPDEVERAAAVRNPQEPLEGYVVRIARTKGESVRDRLELPPGDSLIACDTLSEVDGEPLGKPADRADARRMLSKLSGRRHRVVSGVWLWCGGRALEGHAESILRMDPLDEAFLDWYLDSGLWRGKAGACGFQDERLPLRLVSGSGSNVVGFPLELIRTLLARATAPGE